ncbi:pilin [Candidatus Altiarchaeota archaeon]
MKSHRLSRWKWVTAVSILSIFVFFTSLAVAVPPQPGGGDLATEIASPAVMIICAIFEAFVYISGAMATLIIVYAAIRWIGSADDPGARKVAKHMMWHAVMALVIVLVADSIVGYVTGGQIQGCGHIFFEGGQECTGAQTRITFSPFCWQPLGVTISSPGITCCYDTGAGCDQIYSPQWQSCAGQDTGECFGSVITCVGVGTCGPFSCIGAEVEQGAGFIHCCDT